MSARRPPLLDVFVELQRRNLPLGIQEYVHAQEALARGLGCGSRDELIFLCQVLWGKSPDEAALIEDLLRSTLPKELSAGQLGTLLDAMEASERGEGDAPSSLPGEPDDVPREAGEAADESGGGRVSPPGAGFGPRAAIRLDRTSEPTDVDVPVPAIQTGPVNHRTDYVGQLPVARRQMKRAWRYYRRMQRLGAPTELDVSATVSRVYQQGVFLEPVLIPRRSNRARMLVLSDEGGSMIPFRQTVEALLDSASHSGLAKVSAFYFHDVAHRFVYRDRGRAQPEGLEDVLGNFAGAGALIISDGGAARGDYDRRRVEQTGDMLKLVRRFTPNIAWLNPVPETRWPGTSAEAIRRQHSVPMYTLDRAGLDAAVDVLRGR